MSSAEVLSQATAMERPLKRRSFDGSRLAWIILGVLVLAIVAVPLGYTLDAAFRKEAQFGLSQERSLEAFTNVYTTAMYLTPLVNALVLAAVVTVVSLLCGVAMAVLIARVALPQKSLLELLIILPIFLSPFTGLIAWVTLGSQKTGFINVFLHSVFGRIGIDLGPVINIWSYFGIVWVMSLFFIPFAYLFTVGNLRAMDSSLEEAARASGATALQTMLKITLPMSLPAIFAAGLLIFILTAETYAIPGIIGVNIGFTVLPWQTYTDLTDTPIRQAHAAAAGTMLLFVAVLGIWIQRRITRVSERYVTVTGKGFRGRPMEIGAYRWLALAFIGAYILFATLLPLLALGLSSLMKFSAPAMTADLFTFKHYKDLFALGDMRGAMWNTLVLALLSAFVCVGLGFVTSYSEVRTKRMLPRLIAAIAVLPVAVPGLVYAIGLLWACLQTPLYGTVWVLLLAFVAKFLPFGVVLSRSGILQIHPELEQSARLCGAKPFRALISITAPLMKASLIGAFFFIVLLSIKELSASMLLYTQRSQTLAVLTWHYMDGGNYQFAAAIGVIQTLVMITIVVLARQVFRVRLEKSVGKEVGQ